MAMYVFNSIPVKYYGLDVVTHYGVLEKLKITGVVGKQYGFIMVWGCNVFGNHLIMFRLFLDKLMSLSQSR